MGYGEVQSRSERKVQSGGLKKVAVGEALLVSFPTIWAVQSSVVSSLLLSTADTITLVGALAL